MGQQISRRGLMGAGAAAVGTLMLGVNVFGAEQKRTVVVWSEGTAPKKIYPNDINTAIAEGLKADLADWNVVVANLSDPDQGISDELLAKADVLIWWGHKKHGEVKDALVNKIDKRVKQEGMGFIPLHSSHFAKVNKKIMGTPCSWGNYKADCKTCKISVKDPTHPIAKGVPADFVIPNEERYGNPYAVPKADSVVFDGEFTVKDGTTSPSEQGFVWKMGKGKVFYFQAGHETNPIFFDKNIRKIISNAVVWAAPEK